MKRAERNHGEGGNGRSPHERTDEEPDCVPYPLDEGLLKWLRHAAHQTQVHIGCAVQAYQVNHVRSVLVCVFFFRALPPSTRGWACGSSKECHTAWRDRSATLVQELVTSVKQGRAKKKKGLTSLVQQAPPTAVASLRMPVDWAGIFVCPYFGCGEVVSKLSEHWMAHNGAAPGAVSFPVPSATPTVEPELVERAPSTRDPHALSQEGVADFDLLVSRRLSARVVLTRADVARRIDGD